MSKEDTINLGDNIDDIPKKMPTKELFSKLKGTKDILVKNYSETVVEESYDEKTNEVTITTEIKGCIMAKTTKKIKKPEIDCGGTGGGGGPKGPEGPDPVMTILKEILNRLTVLETKVDKIDERLIIVEKKVDALEVRVGNLEAKVDKLEVRVGNLEAKVDKLEKRVENLENDVQMIKTKVNNLENDVQMIKDHLNL